MPQSRGRYKGSRPGSHGGTGDMERISIVLGNKTYSSWSLRGWLALERCGVPFEEIVVPLRLEDSRAAILQHSPSGRVPTLIFRRDGRSETVWDSLAIAETLAERFPLAGLWPEEPSARARARAVTAEMHAGFPALRNFLPMDLRNSLASEASRLRAAPGVAEDIARVVDIWERCRADYGKPAGGDLLFGAFTAADAAFLPVATRFRSYGVSLQGAAADYAEALLTWPAFLAWSEAAAAEPWTISFPELSVPAG